MDKKKQCSHTFVAGISAFVVLLCVTVVLLVFFLYGKSSQTVKAGPKLVIDQDGGADDAMAVFIALLCEKHFHGPTVVALTTTLGNVDEEQVFENTQRILDIVQRTDVPIYRGSKESIVKTHPSDFYFGLDGLGDLDNVSYKPTPAQPEHAVNALIDLSKKYEGELTVVVIGAATNVALAIKLDPHFISRLAHLYVAAGNIYSATHSEPEFNALVDVEAYYIVAQHSAQDKVTFIPFSPFYYYHNISMEWRENVLGAIDTPIMRAQNQFERISNNGSSVWNHLDPKAIAMVLDPTLVRECVCSNNTIILCGEQRGININNFTDCSDSNVKIAFPAADEKFKTFLYDVFSSELIEK